MFGDGDPGTTRFRYFLMAGGVYRGMFVRRDDDFVSFMVAYVRTKNRLKQFQREVDSVASGAVGIKTYECITEIDYRLQVAPWLSLSPNLQYVTCHGGTGNIPDAFVLGLYTKVTL